jgi:hypothetical protein
MSAALWLFFAAAVGSLLALRFRRRAAHEAELLKKTSQRTSGKTSGSSAIRSARDQASGPKSQKNKSAQFGRR